MLELDENRVNAPVSRVTPLRLAGRVARGADRVITAFSVAFLSLVLLFACYALWDTWRIYEGAGIDEDLLKYKPTLENGGEGLAELMKINPDVCAWLTVDDTDIDYPVVQGSDNYKYLNTDVKGEFSLSGSIFLDCRNARDFSDSYSLVYGHHMEGGSMFGALDAFLDEGYFDGHAEGTLFLPNKVYGIELFALVEVDAYDDQVFAPGNLGQSEMADLLERIQGEAIRYRDIGVGPEDRIIALSTCSEAGTNGRVVVFGRLDELEID